MHFETKVRGVFLVVKGVRVVKGVKVVCLVVMQFPVFVYKPQR